MIKNINLILHGAGNFLRQDLGLQDFRPGNARRSSTHLSSEPTPNFIYFSQKQQQQQQMEPLKYLSGENKAN